MHWAFYKERYWNPCVWLSVWYPFCDIWILFNSFGVLLRPRSRRGSCQVCYIVPASSEPPIWNIRTAVSIICKFCLWNATLSDNVFLLFISFRMTRYIFLDARVHYTKEASYIGHSWYTFVDPSTIFYWNNHFFSLFQSHLGGGCNFVAVPSGKPPQTIPFGTNWKHWKAGNRIHGKRVLISLVEETWNINMLRDALKHVFFEKKTWKVQRERISEYSWTESQKNVKFYKTRWLTSEKQGRFFMKIHKKHSKKSPNFGRKIAVKVLGEVFKRLPDLSWS